MLELHTILRRKVFLNEENIALVVYMLKTCYDIFRNNCPQPEGVTLIEEIEIILETDLRNIIWMLY